MSKKNLSFLSAATALAIAVCAALLLAPETRGGNFFLARAAAAQQQKGIVCLGLPYVEEQYDKMGDKTTVKFHPVLVKEFPSREIGVFADFSYPGHAFSKPVKITLGFVHAALSETLNSNFTSRDLTLIIGGEQIPLGQMVYKNKEESGLRGKIQLETMSLELQPSVFVRLANATQATVRLGQTEFTLEDKQLKALRKIVERAKLN